MEKFLFDRDNLRDAFSGWKAKELLHTYGFKTLNDLFTTLIQQKSTGAEYVIGLPGVGKSTFAIKELGAKPITTKKDMIALLTMKMDEMVFVSCNVEDEIAQRAKRITLLHTSAERLKQQRALRNQDIVAEEAETAFGRDVGTTDYALTRDDVLISRLKTDYEDKSRIICYRSPQVEDFERKQEISVKSGISPEKKYLTKGAVLSSGKFAPIHKVHEMLLKQGYTLAQEKALPFCIVMVPNSGGTYDIALTWHEKQKLLQGALQGMDYTLTSETPEFIKGPKKQILKIDRDQSFVFLGKERLPEGFTQGSTQELFSNPQYADFLKSKDSYAVHKMKGAYFFNIGTIAMQGSEESVSATHIRKNLVEGHPEALRPYLSEEVFKILTLPQNMQALQKRHQLLQEKAQKREVKKAALIEKYKTTHPITQAPLLKRDGTPKLLTRQVITAKTPQSEKEKILNYLERVDTIIAKHKKQLHQHYSKKIRANALTVSLPT